MKPNLFLKFFLIIFFLSSVESIHSQIVDSLLNIYKTAKHDTVRTRILLNIGENTFMQDPDSAERTFTKGLNLSLKNMSLKNQANEITNVYKLQYGYFKINLGSISFMRGDVEKAFKANYEGLAILNEVKNEEGIGNIYTNFSQFYSSMGATDSAIFYTKKALIFFKKVNNVNLIALALNNLGLLYDNQGNSSKALGIYFESLKMLEKAKDYKGISYVKHNIAGIYEAQNDLETAQEYYENALALRRKINDVFAIGESYISLGSIMRKKNDLPKALEFYNKAIAIQLEIQDFSNLAVSYNNIGKLYILKGETKKATEFLHKSLELQEKIQDKNGMVYSYNNLSAMYMEIKDYDKAISLTTKALILSKEVGFPENIKQSARQLFMLYKLKGNYQLALENYQLYIKMRDSLNNIETQRSIIKQQTNYEYQQKKIIADAEHNVELKQQELKADAEKNKQRIIIACVSIVLLLVAVFSVFLYNRFKLTQKQKQVIELKEKETHDQKLIIEEKQKEIIDSITYAKRIQSAILPSDKVIKELIPNSFVLYKPKDIVAGDFYWLQSIGEVVLFAAADCTGHGVPGAMVSLVCNNGLNRSIKEFGLSDPGKILDKTRELVIEEFEKSDEDVKDGMDISLCALNFKTKELVWSGANNPIWIVKKLEKQKFELVEIKADKQPIGKYADHKPFTSHKVSLNEGDTIYVFTDGFQDQFGGEKGKKFKASKLKELLFSLQNTPMDEQMEILFESFITWKGSLEQIDDVCVLGLRV